MGGDALFAADEAEAFGGGGLHRNGIEGKTERVGEGLAHRGNVGRDLRLLRQQGAIHVDDLPAGFAHHRRHAGEEDAAVDAGIVIGSVGEMLADFGM